MSHTTIQKRAHEVEIYGTHYHVEVGALIHIDGWGGATRLQGSEWDQAEFYLPSFAHTNVVSAVNIKVTGRKFQNRPYSGDVWVKVKIEFVGDGEPSVFVTGWWNPGGKGW